MVFTLVEGELVGGWELVKTFQYLSGFFSFEEPMIQRRVHESVKKCDTSKE